MNATTPKDSKKVIAAFDFDGTITTRDTLAVFIKFAVPVPRLLARGILLIPSMILYKLKIIPNYTAKENLFRQFFGGMTVTQFNNLSYSFKENIDKIVNPAAMEKIKWHQQMGHQIIIISASAENWIQPWASQQGINVVLATQLQVKNNHITGRFLTKNCHGIEKVNRLIEKYANRDEYILYAYGDSNGDKELLAFADHSFYRSF